MDAAVNRYIESLEREMASPAGPSLPLRGDLAPYLVEPFDTACVQGAFRYAARALAQRGARVLFLAYDTQQYGVGLWNGSHGGLIDAATQYLTPETAVRTFLLEE